MTTVKQLEKRVDELEDKIEKLIKAANKKNWHLPYEKPVTRKCPCCGQKVKNSYGYRDRVVY